MAGVIFLFFSILVGMWVFARIMYPSRGKLPLPNQDAPAKVAEVNTNLTTGHANAAPKPKQTDIENSIKCATCAEPLTPDEAVTHRGVHFCSAEHLIAHRQSN